MRVSHSRLTALLLVLAAGCAPEGRAPDAAEFRGRVFPEPLPKPDFTLSDTRGDAFDFQAETQGHVTLLFFGYTHCPDVCPIHMANIAAVMDDFSYELRQRFKVVFVTTDPERDTPERIRAWLDNFDSSFIGLRGSAEEVNQIMASLYLPGAVKQPTPDGDYAVGHSASVIAFSADGPARVAYPFGTRQADWAHDLPKLAADNDDSD